jgi:site-specific recombinase XerC
VRTYTEAVQWFAAAYLRRQGNRTCWEEVKKRDVQEWVAWLLGRYSAAYASNQYRALQQFFKWLAGEEDIPDPMAGLKPPRVTDKPVPIFAGDELSRLARVCVGRGFPERRDAAIIALLEATGIRLSELAGIQSDPGDPRHGDVDLWHREITVHGKGARRASSRSAMTPPAASTGTSASAPGTPRPTGRSCGSGSTTGAR